MEASAAPPPAAGAPPHGEVIAAHDDPAAVDAGEAHDEVAGAEVEEVALVVVFGAAGELASLGEAAGVHQAGDAFADGELAAVVLAFDVVRAAHLAGEFGAA